MKLNKGIDRCACSFEESSVMVSSHRAVKTMDPNGISESAGDAATRALTAWHRRIYMEEK